MFNKTLRYGMFTILFLVISACSTPKLDGFEKAKVIERAEVIRASKDCIDARMRPVIQSLPQKTDHGTIMYPVSVQCETYNVR
jgi:hypothetical protein